MLFWKLTVAFEATVNLTLHPELFVSSSNSRWSKNQNPMQNLTRRTFLKSLAALSLLPLGLAGQGVQAAHAIPQPVATRGYGKGSYGKQSYAALPQSTQIDNLVYLPLVSSQK